MGFDSHASDLNPIACMLTWGAFNIVGADKDKRAEIDKAQKSLALKVQQEIDALGGKTSYHQKITKALHHLSSLTREEVTLQKIYGKKK